MSTEQAKYNFYEITKHYLSNTSLLNLFNILYETETKEYFLNIFRNYIVNTTAQKDLLYFLQHEIDDTDFPDTISNEYYNTPHLWWATGIFNDILNPFEGFDEHETKFLKILRPQYIFQLMQELTLIGTK